MVVRVSNWYLGIAADRKRSRSTRSWDRKELCQQWLLEAVFNTGKVVTRIDIYPSDRTSQAENDGTLGTVFAMSVFLPILRGQGHVFDLV
jgi:hypothetical protein